MLAPKANVLLVGGTATQGKLIRDTLASATGGPFQVEHVGRLADAIEALAEKPADVVMLDIPLPDAEPLAALSRVTSTSGAGVVLMLRPPIQELETQAMKAGANAVLVKEQLWELDGGRMARVITAALAARRSATAVRRTPRKSGALLSFIGAKGGTHTSSVSLRVARTLAARGGSTLLVELAPWAGTLRGLLGTDSPAHVGLLGSRSPGEIHATALGGMLVDVAPNLKALLGAPGGVSFGMDHAMRLLETLPELADHVLLDLPCEPSDLVRLAVQASSFVSLVVEADWACVRQGRRVVDLLHGWSVDPGRLGGVVVERSGEPAPMPDLAESLGCPVIARVPVPPGSRLIIRKGEDTSRLIGTEDVRAGLSGIVDRIGLRPAAS